MSNVMYSSKNYNAFVAVMFPNQQHNFHVVQSNIWFTLKRGYGKEWFEAYLKKQGLK